VRNKNSNLRIVCNLDNYTVLLRLICINIDMTECLASNNWNSYICTKCMSRRLDTIQTPRTNM